MAFKVTVLLHMFTLTYLLTHLVLTSDAQTSYSISLVVYNSLTNQKNLTFTTDVAYRGILLGAMRRIEANNMNFRYILFNSITEFRQIRFTIKEDPNYGPFLISVNGVAGDVAEHTYWELLAKQNGTIIRPNVGVGCYIPNPNDTVILKFTKW